jgi:hypothetical protein
MIDVGGDDRGAARDFAAHELGRDELGNRGAEALACWRVRSGSVRSISSRSRFCSIFSILPMDLLPANHLSLVDP